MSTPIWEAERAQLITRMQEAHSQDNQERFESLKSDVQKIDKKLENQSYLDEQSIRSAKDNNADKAQSSRVVSDYNLGKALRHAARGGVWDGIEGEMQSELRSQAGGDKHPENAVLIPNELFEQRTVTSGASWAMVSTESYRSEEFLKVLRNRTISSALGARQIQGVSSKVKIPRQGNETMASWQTEVGTVAESTMTFLAPIELEAHRLSYTTSHSDQVVREQTGGLPIQRLIIEEGALAMSQAIDNAIFATGWFANNKCTYSALEKWHGRFNYKNNASR